MFARRAYEPRMAASISPWWFELRGRMGASGLHEWCSAWTRVDSITACGPSPDLVRPPWHGRGQGSSPLSSTDYFPWSGTVAS